MTEKEINIIADSMKDFSRTAVVTALKVVKVGFEKLKGYTVNVLNQNGECVGIKQPYYNDDVRIIVDYMNRYLEAAIKEYEK